MSFEIQKKTLADQMEMLFYRFRFAGTQKILIIRLN